MTIFFQNAANFATKKIVDFVIYRFFFKNSSEKQMSTFWKKLLKEKAVFVCFTFDGNGKERVVESPKPQNSRQKVVIRKSKMD